MTDPEYPMRTRLREAYEAAMGVGMFAVMFGLVIAVMLGLVMLGVAAVVALLGWAWHAM